MPEQSKNAPVIVDWDYQLSVPTQWHIRGKNPTMHLVSEEQMETLASSGNPWPLALFTLTGGVAASLWAALYAGGIAENVRGIFWAVFWAMAILTLAFGITAVRDYLTTKKMKQDIKRQSPTIQAEAPTIQARQK